jgi:hypothetical protein
MTHPDPECNKKQAEFLATCKPEERRFHELMFIIGNISYRYYQKTSTFDPSIQDWNEWIEGLNEPMKSGFKSQGFKACQEFSPSEGM